MNILVTGKNGFIGKHIVDDLSKKYNVISTSKSDLDLTNSDEVEKYLKDKDIDIIINSSVVGGKSGNNDTPQILYDNLSMLFNIIKYKSKKTKIFNFTSGAELENGSNNFMNSYPLDYYGMSKNLISRITYNLNDVYTFRLFGVFGEYESEYRFVKKNILSYINQNNLRIKNDRYLDFLYIDNIVKVIDYYIINGNYNLNHFIDVTTPIKYKLSDVLMMINELDNYKVEIIIDNDDDLPSYVGDGSHLLDIVPNYISLDVGIYKVFNYIKNKI